MSKRPNVQRMRRAMERDEAHRLKRTPELRIPIWDMSMDADAIQSRIAEWQRKVARHYPSASFTAHRNHLDDEMVVRFTTRQTA